MSHKVGEKPVAYELDCLSTQSDRVLAVTCEKTWSGSICPYRLQMSYSVGERKVACKRSGAIDKPSRAQVHVHALNLRKSLTLR